MFILTCKISDTVIFFLFTFAVICCITHAILMIWNPFSLFLNFVNLKTNKMQDSILTFKSLNFQFWIENILSFFLIQFSVISFCGGQPQKSKQLPWMRASKFAHLVGWRLTITFINVKKLACDLRHLRYAKCCHRHCLVPICLVLLFHNAFHKKVVKKRKI